jgi:hypothetical protein
MGENLWLRKPTEYISITPCILPLILVPIFRAPLSSAQPVSEVCRGGSRSENDFAEGLVAGGAGGARRVGPVKASLSTS